MFRASYIMDRRFYLKTCKTNWINITGIIDWRRSQTVQKVVDWDESWLGFLDHWNEASKQETVPVNTKGDL